MAYQTQRLKGLQKKMDILKMGEIDTEQRLETINFSIKRMDMIIKQEQDRIQTMGFGDKK